MAPDVGRGVQALYRHKFCAVFRFVPTFVHRTGQALGLKVPVWPPAISRGKLSGYLST